MELSTKENIGNIARRDETETNSSGKPKYGRIWLQLELRRIVDLIVRGLGPQLKMANWIFYYERPVINIQRRVDFFMFY
ncbi:hypothetical protein PNOK_0275300 [Pyrrhoderma noxium]|uniref:Uncharacterized protein n=1 Tax=Pyrrhoderma noxium TaxID=2282107 RepID=A0A286UT60_9AGAM|nr:hypothetical protein PNOK_0275300 [Pyrrhoderma noxium]